MTAFDEQNPDLKARANAVIFVDFNPNGPVFSQINYQERISEYYGLGKSVLAVMATDADNVSTVSSFHIFYFKSI